MNDRYYKWTWNEKRGDDYDSWGTSIWYAEVDAEKFPSRQIEVYQNGNSLKYDTKHLDDKFGGLGDQKIELEDFDPPMEVISKEEFEKLWKRTGFIDSKNQW